MGQMVTIDETELSALKFKASYYNAYVKIIDECEEKAYPYVEYWTDCSCYAEANLIILNHMKNDLIRYHKRKTRMFRIKLKLQELIDKKFKNNKEI